MRSFATHLFHPLTILLWLVLLTAVANPYQYGISQLDGLWPYLIVVGFTTLVLPALAIAMMYKLELVSSERRVSNQSALLPLFAVAILYSTLYFYFKQSGRLSSGLNLALPTEFLQVFLGVVISVYLTLILSLFQRMNYLAIGFGNLVMALMILYTRPTMDQMEFVLWGHYWRVDFFFIIFLLMLINGVLTSLQIRRSEFSLKDVLGAWLVGVTGQVAAALIYT